MKQKVSWALNSGEMMTLVEKFNIEIRGKDIRTLSPGCWLNDEVGFFLFLFITIFYIILTNSFYNRSLIFTSIS